jgi:cell wall-associated NlpC family hydrolase
MTTTLAGGVTVAAESAIAFCRAQLGKPYRFGTTGPDTFDCSGLVYAAYKHAGINIPRTTFLIVNVGIAVSRDALIPGDLVFPNPHHVQMYIGGGRVIEAPEAGIPVRNVAMWGFWKARRVTQPSPGVSGPGLSSGPASDSFSNVTDTSSTSLANPFTTVTQGSTWIRLGMFLAGAVLVIIALLSMTKGLTRA